MESQNQPQLLEVEYAGRCHNRIEKIERHKKMILHFTHPNLPRKSHFSVPSHWQTDSSVFKKLKKSQEEIVNQNEFKAFHLIIEVLNGKGENIFQCGDCMTTNTHKNSPGSRNGFVLIRSSHLFIENRRLSIPVMFFCCPSHHETCNTMTLDLKLISNATNVVEFASHVPLHFKKHWRRKSPQSPLTSSPTHPTQSSSSKSSCGYKSAGSKNSSAVMEFGSPYHIPQEMAAQVPAIKQETSLTIKEEDYEEEAIEMNSPILPTDFTSNDMFDPIFSPSPFYEYDWCNYGMDTVDLSDFLQPFGIAQGSINWVA